MIIDSKTISSYFSSPRQIRCIRRSVPRTLIVSLVVSLVFSRLDYCISILYGSPSALLRRLQSILHAAARLIFRSSRHSHVSPLLRQLQWLFIPQRIGYRLAVLAHSSLQDTLPRYLSDEIKHVSVTPGRRSIRSASSRSLAVRFPTQGTRLSADAASRWLQPELGINCLQTSKSKTLLQHLNVSSGNSYCQGQRY